MAGRPVSFAGSPDEHQQAGSSRGHHDRAAFAVAARRLAETDRLETFSDSVLSITITLLVAEIVRPELAPGQLLDKLTAQWASYIAFLASFCYAGVIWLNHRAMFARVRYCDRSPSPSQPFPSADVCTDPFSDRYPVHRHPERQRIRCQGGGDPLCRHRRHHVPVMAGCVSRSEHTSVPGGRRSPDFFPKERFRAWLGVILYAIAGLAGWLSTPRLAFLVFLAMPVFYGITSEGLTETTNSPAVWQGPSWSYREERSFGEKRSRGGAHRMTFGGGAIFTVSGSCMQFVQPPASLATSSDRPASHRPISRHQ